MRVPFFRLIAAIVVVAAVVPVHAAGEAAGKAGNAAKPRKNAAVEQVRTRAEKMAKLPAARIDEVVRFGYARGSLTAEYLGPRDLPAGGRFAVPGSDDLWTLTARSGPAAPNSPAAKAMLVSIAWYDFDAAEGDDIWQIILSLSIDRLTITARGGTESDVSLVTYAQTPGSVRLMIRTNPAHQQAAAVPVAAARPGANAHNLANTVSAESLAALLEAEPELVRQYLRPMLKRIAQKDLLRPGPADVYRAFTDVPADPAATTDLEALLPMLDSPVYQERLKGVEQLRQRQRPAVLAAVRYDPALLSPEQRMRLEEWLSSHATRAPSASDAGREDSEFLTDCLVDEDRRVRAAALEALEKLVGCDLPIDITAAEPQIAAEIAAVRPWFPAPSTAPATGPGTTTAPTTAPATGPASATARSTPPAAPPSNDAKFTPY